MIKYFCDCCGKQEHRLNSLELKKHVEDLAQGRVNGYVDQEGNTVSGITNRYDLCNKCYNDVALVALNKFFELKTIADESVGKV